MNSIQGWDTSLNRVGLILLLVLIIIIIINVFLWHPYKLEINGNEEIACINNERMICDITHPIA